MTPSHSSTGLGGTSEEHLAVYLREQKKALSLFKTEGDVSVSVFVGLSLKEYIEARSFVCKTHHKQPCRKCCGLLEVARTVSEKGFITLKSAYEIAHPGATYKSTPAKRYLLQMPLASIGAGSLRQGNYCIFIVEKQDDVKYKVLQSLLSNWLESQVAKPPLPSKEKVNNLLELADSEAERKRLQYAIVSAAGLSNKKAKSKYGFSSAGKTVAEVDEVLRELTATRESIEEIAHIRSLNVTDYSDSDSSVDNSDSVTDSGSEDESAGGRSDNNTGCNSGSSEDTVNSSGAAGEVGDGSGGAGEVDGTEGSEHTGQDGRREFQLRDDQYKHMGETGECYMNTHQLLDILYDCNLNWLKFVYELEQAFPNVGEHALEQLLLDFAGQLPFLNLSLNDERIIEQSRQVYLLQRRLQEMERDIDNGIIVSEYDSDSPEELIKVRNPLDEAGKQIIRKKRAAIRRKEKREFRKRIAESRYLKRRKSKRIGKIQRDCPDIGKTIEEYVKKCGIGADAWRRTGILTFDGNTHVESHIQKDTGTPSSEV